MHLLVSSKLLSFFSILIKVAAFIRLHNDVFFFTFGDFNFLTDNNAFFLTTDVPNGMKHFERTPLTTSMDGDFDTGNVRYKARERYSFGWSDPLGIWGSPGST